MQRNEHVHRGRKFTHMYEAFADDIFRYLYAHVRDKALAEDLTADTFMRAWSNLHRFDFKQPRPWLYKIARNLLTDHWRKKRPESLEAPDDLADEDDEGVAEEIDRVLNAEQVQAAIAKLPGTTREVVTMRFILGYSVRQTAEALGLTESNVRVLQYRALKKLRGLLS